MKNEVKFSNYNTLDVEGIGDVLIMRKYDKMTVISNVLYIEDMKINLLSIGQPIKKNYKVLIGYEMMRVLDSSVKLISKAPMP